MAGHWGPSVAVLPVEVDDSLGHVHDQVLDTHHVSPRGPGSVRVVARSEHGHANRLSKRKEKEWG